MEVFHDPILGVETNFPIRGQESGFFGFLRFNTSKKDNSLARTKTTFLPVFPVFHVFAF